MVEHVQGGKKGKTSMFHHYFVQQKVHEWKKSTIKEQNIPPTHTQHQSYELHVAKHNFCVDIHGNFLSYSHVC